ncbi:hypothetical protein Pmani_030381 [Petrolisthes manimaculis]|uniref:Uncharacterized protein n=1 Tax=Petrolisthes manimaculis TaxID=1843537 RepID=A0AAE1TSX7_9EUCA|nr:hypothetical protein Pmani_030381 [Petrolisthes manimaculis]
MYSRVDGAPGRIMARPRHRRILISQNTRTQTPQSQSPTVTTRDEELRGGDTYIPLLHLVSRWNTDDAQIRNLQPAIPPATPSFVECDL